MNADKQTRTTIFPLAVTVGLLTFLVTSELSAGLTGLQGFFVGFGAVFGFFLIVALFSRRKLPPESKSTHVEDVTIGETEEEITIRIRLDQLGHVQATSRR